MAITTMAGITSGMNNGCMFFKQAPGTRKNNQWINYAGTTSSGNNPGAWTLGTPGINGANITSINALGGTLPIIDNPSGANKYISKIKLSWGVSLSGIMIYDLLWYNTGIGVTTTTLQAITTPGGLFPARDADGTTNGNGVEIWLMAVAATTNAGAISNTTLNYTNEAGTTNRSAGLAISYPAGSGSVDMMIPFGLQGADKGVRAITNASGGGITLGSSYVTGSLSLLAIRPLVKVFFQSYNYPSGIELDALQLGFPRVYDNSNLYIAGLASNTNPGDLDGRVYFSCG